MKTTTIGSYPKPDYLRIPEFVPKHPDPTRRYEEYLSSRTPDDDALLAKATADNVSHQIEAGIDIPTDGETPRSHYVHYHLKHLGGVDFVDLSERVTRGGAWKARFPTIRSAIQIGEHFLPEDYKRAQSSTSKPVKITLPGPMTIIDSTVDVFYNDSQKLGEALADALNYEIRALVDAGCTHIQVDEPVFARQAGMALEWGIANLDRVFDGVPDSVDRTCHICCGYPSGLDLADFPKAPRESYFQLAQALNATCIDTVSLEDAHRHNDLSLLEHFPDSKVILGVVEIANTTVESVDVIHRRLKAACEHIEVNRLLAGPDCGLAMLPRELVFKKLNALSEAAHAI